MDRPGLELPDYNIARGGIYGSLATPPFDFDGVTLRIFPLRARLERLQSFIDGYLNMVPPELAYFRAFAPYVHLVFVHYGRLSLDAANLGWISQSEVLFGIPLLWYKKIAGELVFQDYATVSPFIYVDSDHSMTTGREVYGWPKDRIYPDSSTTAWMKNPEATTTLAHFNIRTFEAMYAGSRLVKRPLLTIRQTAGSALARLPLEPEATWLPWVALPKAISGAWRLTADYVEAMRGLGLFRMQPGAGPSGYARMSSVLARSLRPYSSEMIFNTINLKQFRDAEEPHLAAYQAITNAPMLWRRIRRGGLLGDTNVLRGDTSGGFSIDLYRPPSASIVELLGLETQEELGHGDGAFHTLRPVLPTWLEVDMRYSLGQNIAWRSKGHGWQDGRGEPPQTQAEDRPHYTTARAAAETALVGPFEFPDTTLRVMPLLADEKRLESFLEGYLGEPLKGAGIEVHPWGRYVYLVASSYEGTSSRTNDVGWWADRDVVLYVPARVTKDKKPWRVVLVPVYAFANSAVAAHTGREVNGLSIASATLDSPPSEWMNAEGPPPASKEVLLTVSAAVLPAAGTGQEVAARVVLEVFEGDAIPAQDEARWRTVAQGWGQKVKDDLERKRSMDDPTEDNATLRALDGALQILIGERRMPVWILKQFRDAHEPQKACYQALVEVEQELTAVHCIEEIESGLYVRIPRYSTQPIVETLGLVPMMQEVSPGGVLADVLEPIRPFWMKVSRIEHLGKNLLVRAGAEWEEPAAPASAGAVPPFPQSASLQLMAKEPRRLPDLVREIRKKDAGHADNKQASHGAIAEVSAGTEPQLIVERILSEEWERWGPPPPRWQRALQEMTISFQRADDVSEESPRAAAGSEYQSLYDKTETVEDRLPARLDIARSMIRDVLVLRVEAAFRLDLAMKGALDSPTKAALVASYMKWLTTLEFETEGAKSACVKRVKKALTKALALEEKEIWERQPDLRWLACAHRKMALITLSKGYQKRHHVIRRAMIANEVERERLLPQAKDAEWWIEGWYDGSERTPLRERLA